jgi:dienelactone hydrolase
VPVSVWPPCDRAPPPEPAPLTRAVPALLLVGARHLLALAAVPTPVQAAPAPVALRYDLRPGDHLVYRQRLERGRKTASVESLSEAEWESHVLVLAERGGSWRVGIERNRTRAELLRYREDGRDRLEAERPAFVEGLAKRGTTFAETSWLTPSGAALLPWAAAREATSERLPFFHEIEPLPAAAVAPGASFASPGLLGLPMKAVGVETVAGEECLRLEGESAGMKLRHWHCPGSGTLGRLEYEAQYGGPGGAEVTERYRLERVSQARGGDVASWLRDAKTARGALTALAATDRLDVAPQTLYALLDGAEADVERLVLAVAWRHRLTPPPADVLRRLAASPSPRVAAIASRFLDAPARPKAPDELVRLARAVRSGAELPAWNGPSEAGWGRKALLAQRAPGQVPGTTLRLMRAERFRGRPYVLHVPDDYRGDEPFPMVVILGGGPGRAIPTAQTARPSIEPRDELAVFPQANGMWWEEEPAAAVEALLAEVLSDLNVDTDRVTITGFSNGGTGSLLYASRMPHRFAAVASLMGGGLPFFEATGPIDAAAIARIPFLFVHGDHDDVIPPWASERTAKAMRQANPRAEAEVHLLAGRPHDVVYGRDDGLTFPFLEGHVREAFPRQVSLRARTLDHPRAFWAEVVEKDGGVAQVDGSIDGATIALRTRNVRRLRLRLRRELLDLSAPVRVTIDGKEAFRGPVTEDPTLLLRSWRETGDPQLAHSAEITLDVR